MFTSKYWNNCTSYSLINILPEGVNLICALKLKQDIHTNVDVPKAVFSYWPQFNNNILQGMIGNVSLTFRHQINSSSSINGAVICLSKDHILGGHVKNISITLLDETNPLSTSYTGLYQKSPESGILLKYDGVDNVFVDYLATFQVIPSKHHELDFLKIVFSRSIPPGMSIAVRFLYFTKKTFDVGRDFSIHFTQTFFDERIVTKAIGETNLRKMQMPFLTNYDSFDNGGFDIFYYMPLELRGEYFETEPIRRLRLNYNHMGEKTEKRFKKHSWQAKKLLNISQDDPVLFGLSNQLIISGVFTFRETGGISMGDISNKDGIIIVGSSINESTISAAKGIDDDEYKDKILKLEKLILELESELAKNEKLKEEQRALIQSFTQTIKNQKEYKNKKLLSISLEGLYEASKNLVNIAPNVIKIIDNIKDLFS